MSLLMSRVYKGLLNSKKALMLNFAKFHDSEYGN